MDPRIQKLAYNLLHYSVDLQPGEGVLIEGVGRPYELISALVDEAYAMGGKPYVDIRNQEIWRKVLMGIDESQLQLMAEFETLRMKEMKAYIGIRAADNISELSDVPTEKMALYEKIVVEPVHHGIRVPHTKWCVLRYPNSSFSQLARMSSEQFENFFFRVCNLDYNRLSSAMDPLGELMEKTDEVRITGPGTDLAFSIKGLPAIKCAGKHNIPDGEVFTAPVRESVEGFITYNTPAPYRGFIFEKVRLEFSGGKIVKAEANDNNRIKEIFDIDEGARYVGEFSLGLNPYIDQPMLDILFDEKISGSFHFTPGSSYDECFNGNKSAVHWDLVCIQTPAFGGGEIRFDGTLIRKDGKFVHPALTELNPENFMG